MKKNLTFICALTIGSVLGAASWARQAPEQTVEGAQRFLSMVLPGNGYTSGGFRDAVRQAGKNAGASVMLDGAGKVTDASTVSRCTSRILYDNSSVSLIVTAGRRTQRLSVYDLAPGWVTGGKPGGFHWGEVKEVKQVGGTVELLFKGNTTWTTVHLGSNDLAARVAYAMEYLRIHCDPTASTGF